ncbi:hypothetical protein [Sulfuriroseicoccus oceanibius]|uniref:Uncharacterized protein n=1 Tax=Sulfuriroseicoccus oceanibius TaxID=2707525 RepID=A0A6B3L8U7_9BACT|nr:hypothetical protein [Sulfuriroseicoccus oceanibius]QQL45872.1 hypothetical protein G3M56_004625 [Sulfuriroseicoccus oceanibius]
MPDSSAATPPPSPLESIVADSQWPDDGTTLNLQQALTKAGQTELSNEIHRAQSNLETARAMLDRPIIAVTGQLNAGKSSVVASFLSKEGQARIPRGEGSATATHRFVYWVPQSWLDQPDKKATLLDLMTQAHGGQVEFLDPDPEKSAAQYRSGRDHLDQLATPLVAGDPALEPLGAAILDCPDVQTHDHDAGDTQNPRLEFLAAASRVCSAFLMVWKRDAIRDRICHDMLSAIRSRMGSAPLFLLVNMIRPEPGQPATTLDDPDLTRLLESFHIARDHVFGAFDFMIESRNGRPGWRELTPPAMVEGFDHRVSATGDEFPTFFRLSEGTASTTDLAALTTTFQAAELQKVKIASHEDELTHLQRTARSSTEEWIKESRASIAATRDGLLKFCTGMMTDRSTGEPLQIPSIKFANALNDSFIRTAPLALKFTLKLAKPFDSALANGKRWLKKLNPFNTKLSDLESDVKDRLNLGSVRLANAQSLATEMHSQRWCPAYIPIEDLASAWSSVVTEFNAHPIENFDPTSLDAITKSSWESMTAKQRFSIGGRSVLGALGGVAALGGLVTAAVDGGATLYAATAISSAIPGVTALAIGIGGMSVGAVAFQNELIKKNTLPYLSRLFALACDAFALPRKIADSPINVEFTDPSGKQTTHNLPEPTDLPSTPRVTPLTEDRLWKARD